ncbi:LysR family transcriptional regulator, partial [Gemmiger sp.]
MTLTDCQIFMTVSQLGTFAAAAEQMHLTPSAISHAVSGMESECGFLLFTRTKSGVTMTAAAESLLPSIRQMLNSSELLSQSIAQVNGMHKG